MANTYKALSTVTVGAGGASSISFTNIPATYTDLKLVLSARAASTAANWALISINGGSDTAVTLLHILNNSGSVISQTYSSFRIPINQSSYTANTFANAEIYLPNYLSSSNKSMSADGVQESNTSGIGQQLAAFRWDTTSPITSLVLTVDGGGNFAQYSTATLYGVFNADVSSAPATPTIGTATAGSSSASITFTGVSNAASYTMTSTPGSFTGTGTSSPITVSGLTNGTSYTFKVKANNPFGSSAESAASNSVTPVAPPEIVIATTSSPYVGAYSWSSGFGSKYADPSTLLTTSANAVSWSGNKQALVLGVTSTPRTAAYEWITGTGFGFKYSDPATTPTGRQLGASFHPNNNAAATGGDGSHANAWPFTIGSGGGFGTKYADPSPAPGGGFAVRFNHDGSYIAVSNNSASPYLSAYAFSGGFGTKVSNPATIPLGESYGTAWTHNSNAILFNLGLGSGSVYVIAYSWSAGFGSKYANPSSALSSLPGRVTNFNSNSTAWVGGGTGSPYVNAYTWSSGFGTKYSNPATQPSAVVENAFFLPDDSAVIFSSQGSPNLHAYAWTSGGGFGSKYADPATSVAGTAYGLDVK